MRDAVTPAEPIGHSLSTARSSLAAAVQLLKATKYRRKQFEVLTSCCDGMLQQYTSLVDGLPKPLDDMSDSDEDVEDACESLKSILHTVNEKGLLWCLMNPDRIDILVSDCEQKLEAAFRRTQLLMGQERSRKLILARHWDREALSRSLTELSQNESGLLETLQDARGVYRTSEEVFVAVVKHVKNLNLTRDTSPEAAFFQDAEIVLSRMHENTGTKLSVDKYVLSSIEVEIDMSLPIGRGASGEVYKGDWNGAIVAVKRMHVDDAKIISDKQRRNAIRHEVKIWSGLHHPNVLTFYGACLEATAPFLVMKYCQFGSINNYLVKYPMANRTTLSQEIAIGLSFLHSEGIVHADVKGANVLIGDDHHALLSDFGLALKLHQIRTRASYSDDLVGRRGTLLWMAPEVLMGDDPGVPADVYSLGLTIWEIFSGDIPFKNLISADLLVNNVVHQRMRPDRPAKLTENHVWNIVQRCWSPDAGARPTAKEVQIGLKALPRRIDKIALSISNPDTQHERALHRSSTTVVNSSSATMSDTSIPTLQKFKPRLDLGTNRAKVLETSTVGRQKEPMVSPDAFNESLRAPKETSSPLRFTSKDPISVVAPDPDILPFPSIDSPAPPKITVGPSHLDPQPIAEHSPTSATLPEGLIVPVLSYKGRAKSVSSPRSSRDSEDGYGYALAEDLPLPFVEDSSFSSDDTDHLLHPSQPRPRASSAPARPAPFTAEARPYVAAESHPHDQISYDPDSPFEFAQYDSPASTAPPELPWELGQFFAATGLKNSFKIRERILRNLINRATFLSRDRGTHSSMSSDSIKRLVRLSMYQSIIYCDDSSFVGASGLFDFQRDVVGRMVELTTKYRLNNGNHGVELRFVNASTALRVSNSNQVHDGWQHIRPRGGNKIGTGLRSKILEPLVYNVLEGGRRLERPLLVNVITDYGPDAETRSTFKDTIVECKQRLVDAGYKSTDVLFTVTSVTGDTSAIQFLDELKKDPQLSNVLSCTAECFQDIFNDSQADEKWRQDWLLHIVTAPIMKLETAYLFVLRYLAAFSQLPTT